MSRKVGTSNSRCKKSEFVPFEKVGNNVFVLRWGKKDEVEKVGKIDEATGEWVLTGEVKETDYCSYEVCRWYGQLTPYWLNEKIMAVAKREATMEEYNAMLVGLELEDGQRLMYLREKLIDKTKVYGSSRDTVDDFTVNGISMWLDKHTRTGLELRFNAELAKGMTSTTLWDNGIAFPLPLTGEGNAFDMLHAIELYASACYDNTQKHLAAVAVLESADEVLAYDYTTGYPEKLAF